MDELFKQLNIKQLLKIHLIKKGLTFSAEGEAFGEPTVMREIAVDTVVDEVIKFMDAVGYAKAN